MADLPKKDTLKQQAEKLRQSGKAASSFMTGHIKAMGDKENVLEKRPISIHGGTANNGQKDSFDNLLHDYAFSKLRVGIWLSFILLVILIIWSLFAELDEVAIAIGEVVPQEQLKLVQHLEGGVVEKLLVQEGDRVKAGDLLVQLKLGASAVNRNEILATLDGLTLTKMRLQAETRMEAPVFPEDLQARWPELTANELAIYEARLREQQKRVEIARERLLQKRLEYQEIVARNNALKRDLEFAKDRLSMSGELVEQGLTPRMDHLKLQSEVNSMQGELTVMESSLPKAGAAIKEAENALSGEQDAYKRRATEELGEVQRRVNSLEHTLNTASEQASRADVTAPIDGIVKTLRFNTIGGVVRPGEAILDIVPATDDLIIRAKLDPKDRGYVIEGLPAEVKVTTFDYARYGGLEGVVERISASTDMTQEGQAYYTLIVRTDKTYLGDNPGDFEIQPGMQAIVDVRTGTRTVLDFLIRPVLKLRHEAFRER